MISFFQSGGIFMWPLLMVAIIIVFLAVRKIIDVFFLDIRNQAQLKNGINAILFWGCFSVVLGVFAHFVGIYMAMQAIMSAGDISPAIVAHGYALSLITILSGLVLFMISALIWLLLQWRFKSRFQS